MCPLRVYVCKHCQINFASDPRIFSAAGSLDQHRWHCEHLTLKEIKYMKDKEFSWNTQFLFFTLLKTELSLAACSTVNCNENVCYCKLKLKLKLKLIDVNFSYQLATCSSFTLRFSALESY